MNEHASLDEWTQQSQLADFDSLLAAVRRWMSEAPEWPPFVRARALWRRFEPQLRDLQVRLDHLLVVGVFGGTGVGKSTLSNALVGQRMSRASDEQRPTTVNPVVICRPDVDLAFLQLDGCQPEILRTIGAPLLDQMILIDCPDPDTQGEHSTSGDNRNLETLRRVLPHCDVMIHVGTAQKYKTHAVSQELLNHAPGRQVIFVQTHANCDDDIRPDWQRHLEVSGFRVPQVFRVDSEEALNRRELGRSAAESFGQLIECLQVETSRRARHRIKRSNALDMLDWLVTRIEQDCAQRRPALDQLQTAIEEQPTILLAKIKAHLAEQIRTNRQMWRRRLLGQTTSVWGGGPFAGFLRLTGAVSGWLGAWGWMVPLLRGKGMMSWAAAGGIAVGKAAIDEMKERRPAGWLAASELGITPGDVSQAQSIVAGFAYEADLPSAASTAEERSKGANLASAARRLYENLDAAINEAAKRRVARKAGPWFHALLELLFCLLPGFLLYRLAENFFYEHLWLKQPLFGLDWLVYAGLWTLVWGFLLRGWLVARLHGGLNRETSGLVENLSASEILGPLFDGVAQPAAQIRQHIDRLGDIRRQLNEQRKQFGQPIEATPFARLVNTPPTHDLVPDPEIGRTAQVGVDR